MKKIILILCFIVSTTAQSTEFNIDNLLINKECISNEYNYTFKINNSDLVGYKIGSELKAFNDSIKKQYNMGYIWGQSVNINFSDLNNSNSVNYSANNTNNTDTTTVILNDNDDIQYYQLCYFLQKIN